MALRSSAFCVSTVVFLSTFIARRSRTIFALSSGQTRAAIALIRVSGSKAASVLEKMTDWKRTNPSPGLLFLTSIRHPVNKEMLDKAMAVWMPGPKTFTGEDCCELHVHGGPSVIADVLEAISHSEDCFPAEPGEFTKRAFYNGKFDLTGVEGLGDLLRAETSAQRKLALRQAGGELKALYGGWRQRLLKCVAHVEAFVDFAEDAHIEDNVLSQAREHIEGLLMEMRGHLSNGRVGERLRDGVRVAIVGEPNVGKSSLLNRICRRPAAIVTPIPGTTRDPLDVALNLNGYPVLFTDTAGLRCTDDIVEQEGVKRAMQKMHEADVVMMVVDASKLPGDGLSIGRQLRQTIRDTLSAARQRGDEDEFSEITRQGNDSLVRSPRIILVMNKIDLLQNGDDFANAIATIENTTIQTSCTSGRGLDNLMETLGVVVQEMCTLPDSVETIPLTQERHRFLVAKAVAALKCFLELCTNDGRDLVFAAESLRDAMYALGKITGEDVTTDEMLDVLFRDFCIGK